MLGCQRERVVRPRSLKVQLSTLLRCFIVTEKTGRLKSATPKTSPSPPCRVRGAGWRTPETGRDASCWSAHHPLRILFYFTALQVASVDAPRFNRWGRPASLTSAQRRGCGSLSSGRFRNENRSRMIRSGPRPCPFALARAEDDSAGLPIPSRRGGDSSRDARSPLELSAERHHSSLKWLLCASDSRHWRTSTDIAAKRVATQHPHARPLLVDKSGQTDRVRD